MITANRYHDISCGHRVHNHESKCAHLHGHNYRIHFSISADSSLQGTKGELDHVGRVLDFSVIKAVLCTWLEDNWDHKFLIWNQDPLCCSLLALDTAGVVVVPFNPTAENMGKYLLDVIGPELLKEAGHPLVKLVSVVIEETRKCSVTVF